jgi:hypothetical protein
LKRLFLSVLSFLLVFCFALAAVSEGQKAVPPQTTEVPPLAPVFSAAELAAKVPPARPDDIRSMDAILRAIYDVISGPAGERDWSRFRSLFLPQARFTETDAAPDGSTVVLTWSVDEFVRDAGVVFAKEGFYENAIVRAKSRFSGVSTPFSC